MNRAYFITLTIVTIFATAGVYCWNLFVPKFANTHAWFILIYLFVFTIVLHIWLTKNKDPKGFIMKYLGYTGIKLFLNLIVIMVYGLNNRPKAVSFAIIFMLLYFLFTIFETSQLIKTTKQKKA